MTVKRCVCVVLLVALAAVLVQPVRAEALEPMTIVLIVGAGIAVVALVAVLVIANVTEGRPRTSEVTSALASPPLVAFETPAAHESP